MEFARYFNVLIIILYAVPLLGILVFLRLKKKKSFTYLALFTLFSVYLYKVLDYTLFQFQSLLLLKHFMPGLMLKGQTAEQSLNLIPLVTLTMADMKTSLLNMLLMIPFGFGLPFIANLSLKKIMLAGMLLSLALELMQFVTGFLAHMTLRVADINDVIFNTIGTAIGCGLFALLGRGLKAKMLQ